MGFNPLLAAKKKAEQSGTDMKTELKAQAPRPAQRASISPSGRGNTSAGNRGFGNNRQSLNAPKVPKGTPTAPYNFVKLNDVVVSAPFSEKLNAGEEQQAYKEFLTGEEAKYSGYFEIKVENITPFFINNGKDKFFSDGVNYLIPGSSLRGAVKNYFKILTNGTMRTGDDGDVTDKYLYYRTFASPFKQ